MRNPFFSIIIFIRIIFFKKKYLNKKIIFKSKFAILFYLLFFYKNILHNKQKKMIKLKLEFIFSVHFFEEKKILN